MPIRTLHTASVEPYLGSGAYGDQYGAAYDLPGTYEGRRQLVRAGDGSEAVSEGTFYAEDADVEPGSRVTVLGRTSYVLTVSVFDGRRGSHVEIALA